MDLTFANPAGLWALLGLPAVVLIHFLQRRARRTLITTLFLLEPQPQVSAAGHRFQRLRSSIPFWLQLAMVLGLTWLLVDPRWVRPHSVQRLAVVVDASASMQPFRDNALTALTSRLRTLAPVADTTEYTVLTSAPEEPRLYHGPSLDEAVQSLASWTPWLGTHDPAPALRAARSTVDRDGIVIFLSDRAPPDPLPFAARPLLVGEPIENVGWTGLTVDESAGPPVIKALVRNFGPHPIVRRWWIESPDGERSPEATLDLAPGQSRLLESVMPAGRDQIVLVLTPDRFTVDDRLPVVRPMPKRITVRVPAGDTPAARVYRELIDAFPHTQISAPPDQAMLVVTGYDPLAPALPEGAACVFASDPQPGATYLRGLLLAEPGPLMDGLNWQGLLVRDTLPIPSQPQDRVLLWQAERPLIIERLSPAGRRQLLFQFDLHTSNARKLPAFAIVLHRFLEQLRAEIVAPESIIVQTGQKLSVARHTHPEASGLSLRTQPIARMPAASTAAAATPAPPPSVETTAIVNPSILRAPVLPSFFEIQQGADRLLTGAAYFADPRESDFAGATADDSLDDLSPVLVERHSQADTRWRMWVLGVLAALLASWYFGRA